MYTRTGFTYIYLLCMAYPSIVASNSRDYDRSLRLTCADRGPVRRIEKFSAKRRERVRQRAHIVYDRIGSVVLPLLLV